MADCAPKGRGLEPAQPVAVCAGSVILMQVLCSARFCCTCRIRHRADVAGAPLPPSTCQILCLSHLISFNAALCNVWSRLRSVRRVLHCSVVCMGLGGGSSSARQDGLHRLCNSACWSPPRLFLASVMCSTTGRCTLLLRSHSTIAKTLFSPAPMTKLESGISNIFVSQIKSYCRQVS